MVTERIAVAMSGGVDSSVAAALLKQQSHEVVGVTMRVTDAPTKNIEDACAVAHKIGIPHHVIDLREVFEKEVIRPFAQSYARGLTPNPCIVCNRVIKFGILAQKARELGAQKLATGHYARVVPYRGRLMVAAGRDAQRDQSYFLFKLVHDDLDSVRFPVGEITKNEVRRIAKELDLGTADKEESREVCFVPGDDYVPVVERYADKLPGEGEIVLGNGEVVGRHNGVHHFTVGQRRGLNVALGRPMYVIEIDAVRGRVIIGGNEECRSEGLVAKNVVWNYHKPIENNMEVDVRIRYGTRPIKARLFPLDEAKIKLIFSEDAPLVTPGQAAVFYLGDLVPGGGWIEKPIR